MNRFQSGLLWVVIASIMAGPCRATDSESQQIDDAFPQPLIDIAVANGDAIPDRFSAHADAHLDGQKAPPSVVAAYSNGVYGAVRVFRKEGSSLKPLAAPVFPLMGGIIPEVKAVDVDNDGRDEVVVSFSTAGGKTSADWVLKWNGTTMQSIGPTAVDQNGNISPVMHGGLLIDLSGSGVFDMVSAGIPPDGIMPVYSLSNGQYSAAGTLNFLRTFRRKAGEPQTVSSTFGIVDVSHAYVLTVVNGSTSGHFVSSAEISLNGAVVVKQSDFNQRGGVIKLPVSLQKVNTLGLILFGAPGSVLTVSVGAK